MTITHRITTTTDPVTTRFAVIPSAHRQRPAGHYLGRLQPRWYSNNTVDRYKNPATDSFQVPLAGASLDAQAKVQVRMEIMPPEIVEKQDPAAVRRILESLPDWFGDPEAIDNYVSAAGDIKFVSKVAVDTGNVVGVSLTRRHFHESAELHLIAVAPAARGQGIGRALIDQVAADLREDGCKLLSVHTVGPSFDNEPYAQTRAFYRATGFYSLEEHNKLDWDGPTLILVRQL